MSLDALYQETILDHYRRPRNVGELTGGRSAAVSNRPCGDQLTVYTEEAPGGITMSFTGDGCALATASASLMTTLINGRAPSDAAMFVAAVLNALSTGNELPHEKLAPFATVHQHPSRVGCVRLGWEAATRLLEPVSPAKMGGALTRDAVFTVLSTITDPELMMNIVDLGFIYAVAVTPPGDVDVLMTLTTPHCPVAETMPRDIEHAVAAMPGVRNVHVRLTFDPPWSKDKMSPRARLLLGMGT